MINSLRMPDDELQGKYIAILHLSWVSCIKLPSIFLWQSSYVVHEQTTTSLLYWLKVLEYEFHLQKNTYTYKVHVLHSTKYLRVKSVQSISHKVGNRKAYRKYYWVLYSIFYNKRTVCILFTFSFPEKDKQIDWLGMWWQLCTN